MFSFHFKPVTGLANWALQYIYFNVKNKSNIWIPAWWGCFPHLELHPAILHSGGELARHFLFLFILAGAVGRVHALHALLIICDKLMCFLFCHWANQSQQSKVIWRRSSSVGEPCFPHLGMPSFSLWPFLTKFWSKSNRYISTNVWPVTLNKKATSKNSVWCQMRTLNTNNRFLSSWLRRNIFLLSLFLRHSNVLVLSSCWEKQFLPICPCPKWEHIVFKWAFPSPTPTFYLHITLRIYMFQFISPCWTKLPASSGVYVQKDKVWVRIGSGCPVSTVRITM